MTSRMYTQRLGTISDEQFQADRAILWEYFQRNGERWWKEGWTFRDWASRYTSFEVAL